MKDLNLQDGDTIVIASFTPDVSSVLRECKLARCRKCRKAVWVTVESRRRVTLGAILLCVQCALDATKGREVNHINPDSTSLAATEFLSLRSVQDMEE